MGAIRGAFGFVLNGQLKLTFNHADSYPAALGENLMDFCRHIQKHNLWDDLKARVGEIELVKDSAKVPVEVLATKKAKALIEKMPKLAKSPNWYDFLKAYQGVEVIWKVSKGELKTIVDANDFPKDSVSCEYAYIIDLDNMVFDVFVGNVKEPDADSPFGCDPYKPYPDSMPEQIFYPCKQIAAYYLDNLPIGTAWQKEIKK